ncbi:Putative ribonuclease H protein At1g65750 [Linum perenne]
MVKLAFIFFQEPEKLWVQVLQSKYMKEDATGLTPRNLTSQSVIWKGLSREWNSMLLGARVAVRNGRETSFWLARWLDSGERLIDSFTCNLEELDCSETVAEFVNGDGQWDVERLSTLLPPNSVSDVVGMPTPRENCGEDAWVWGGESNGTFSIKSAYRIVCRSAPDSNNEESAAHVLRDCSFAKDSWTRLGRHDTSSASWNGDFKTWLRLNLKSDADFIFGTHCWMLWKARNEQIFTGTQSPAASVAIRSLNWSRQVQMALKNDRFTTGAEAFRRSIDVRWEPGPEGWVVLNSDGSVDKQTKRAMAGGVIRSAGGRCLTAFSMNLGNCSITRAEMRGAIEGLKRAWCAGHRRVVLRLDSLTAISILTSSDTRIHQHSMEKLEFQKLIRRD